jgi:hypothetical protein
MPLARIITRSQACSRELALDLLARGYAVEIVSPDKIPDSLADLELRVDAETNPDQLIATVETQDGASLDFIHHLKAPMGDFIRRPPEPESFYTNDSPNDEPVSFNAEPALEDIELPAESPQLVAKIISPSAAILIEPFDEENLQPAVPPEIETLKVETSEIESIESSPNFAAENWTVTTHATAAPIIFEAASLEPTPTNSATPASVRPVDRAARLPWRAAITFAAVVLLALALAVGSRRNGKTAIEMPAATPTAEKVLAASPATNPDPNPPLQSPVPKPDPAIAATTAGAAKAEPVAIAAPAPHHDEVVARDTVTYLDNRYKPVPKSTKHQAQRHSKAHKRDSGIVAANSVTYLNKPAPKPAK